MPLVYQQNINDAAKIGVWRMAETEDFFLQEVHSFRAISHPVKRLQHLAGRYLLKVLEPSINLNEIQLSENGRPFLQGDSFYFSISHSKEFVAVLVSDKNPVGIDIEVCTDRSDEVYNKFLTQPEQDLLLRFIATKSDAYTMGWTIKEALFKWGGQRKVDFKQQLIIDSIQKSHEKFITTCVTKKDVTSEQVVVTSQVFENAFLSWVGA